MFILILAKTLFCVYNTIFLNFCANLVYPGCVYIFISYLIIGSGLMWCPKKYLVIKVNTNIKNVYYLYIYACPIY